MKNCGSEGSSQTPCPGHARDTSDLDETRARSVYGFFQVEV